MRSHPMGQVVPLEYEQKVFSMLSKLPSSHRKQAALKVSPILDAEYDFHEKVFKALEEVHSVDHATCCPRGFGHGLPKLDGKTTLKHFCFADF